MLLRQTERLLNVEPSEELHQKLEHAVATRNRSGRSCDLLKISHFPASNSAWMLQNRGVWLRTGPFKIHLQTPIEFLAHTIRLRKGAAYLQLKLPFAKGRLQSDVDILVPKSKLKSVECFCGLRARY
jgi:hypothetical protein